MKNTQGKLMVINCIARGSKTWPVLSRDIESALGMSGPAVRDAVRELRRSGEPVVATESGYYIAQTQEDIAILTNDLQARANSMLKTISEIKRRAYEKWKGQHQFGFTKTGGGVQGAAAGDTVETGGPGAQEGERGEMLHVRPDNTEGGEGYIQRAGEDGASDAVLLNELVGASR